MELSRILNALEDPSVYPHAADDLRIVHTHASAVVLVGDHVYKLKKPVDFGFLDYSTLARRQAMCRAEVEWNRRLAPDVYLGVVPITLQDGRIALDGGGEIVEYAVHMQRLPDAATWSARLAAGTLDRALIERVGHVVAEFHRGAGRGQDVARWAAFEAVRQHCHENFRALEPYADVVAPRMEFMRLELMTEAALQDQRARIERRREEGIPCETHGDLRLEHVYALPDGRIRIVDCVEFSDSLRCADPVSDIAFLAMDLRAHGAWSEADILLESYFQAVGDEDGRALVPVYVAYRSTVRAKVRALQAVASDMPEAQRARAMQLARAHVQLAVVALSEPEDRPCLVLVGGLPGTGKSVLSRGLAARADFHWLRADAIRKELAGLDPLAPGGSAVRTGIYTQAWNERTYAECLSRAKELLFSGRRVLVDASFKEDARRLAFVDAAREWGVPVRILECTSAPELVKDRLAHRTGDPSDADWKIYEHVRATWDEFSARTAAVHERIDTSGSPEESLDQALRVLTVCGLAAVPRAERARSDA
ncbi:MAG: AAA family ATPase [Planctomycetes bacterium]|nr:AAA family ATPase [Planctomycetota bacterium]